ncbi:hypothetical protein [Pseudonocardia alaniniphila]|uniref:Uncharacterized protein n=1 Tax=Pseudonocardia alaniniphila TaxID=75291 RepID=A0ABS9T9Q3_9PSEU|nr:hypothetical protein [Pseudonocardia alaniniphila]MCH6165252.1 hypothetical protein [Pseudonocardia alaniniphila]
MIRAAAAARERGEIGERGIGARQSSPAAITKTWARATLPAGAAVPLGDIADVTIAVEAEQAIARHAAGSGGTSTSAKRHGRKAG